MINPVTEAKYMLEGHVYIKFELQNHLQIEVVEENLDDAIAMTRWKVTHEPYPKGYRLLTMDELAATHRCLDCLHAALDRKSVV